LQDVAGNKHALYLPGTGGKWKTRSVALSYFNNDVDLTALNGLVLITMEKIGNFAVGDIRYTA